MSRWPVTNPATAPGRPFSSSTRAIIFVTAIEHNEVLDAGFQMVALPAASDSARFLKMVNAWGNEVGKPLVPAVYGHGKVERGYHSYYAERIWC